MCHQMPGLEELLLEKAPKGTSAPPLSHQGTLHHPGADFIIYFLLEAGMLTWALRSLEFP